MLVNESRPVMTTRFMTTPENLKATRHELMTPFREFTPRLAASGREFGTSPRHCFLPCAMLPEGEDETLDSGDRFAGACDHAANTASGSRSLSKFHLESSISPGLVLR